MDALLIEYHERLGLALDAENRLAAVEKLYAEMEKRIQQHKDWEAERNELNYERNARKQ